MKSKKQDSIFMGFYISPEIDQCIRMNAVARNISVSQILRELVNKWKEGCDITEEKLISGIVERIKTDFMILSLKMEVDRAVFLNTWKELLSKKLTTVLVDKIIKEYETKATTTQRSD